MSDGYSYDTHDHDEDWPLVEDAFSVRYAGKEWPERAACMELRWLLVERWIGRLRAKDFPTVRALAAKWGWKPDRAAMLVANVDRWQTDPRRRMSLADLRGERLMGKNRKRPADGNPTGTRREPDGNPTARTDERHESKHEPDGNPTGTRREPDGNPTSCATTPRGSTSPPVHQKRGVTGARTREPDPPPAPPPPVLVGDRELPPDLPGLLFGVTAGRIDAVAALLNAGIDSTRALLRLTRKGWEHTPKLGEPIRLAIEDALHDRWAVAVGDLAEATGPPSRASPAGAAAYEAQFAAELAQLEAERLAREERKRLRLAGPPPVTPTPARATP